MRLNDGPPQKKDAVSKRWFSTASCRLVISFALGAEMLFSINWEETNEKHAIWRWRRPPAISAPTSSNQSGVGHVTLNIGSVNQAIDTSEADTRLGRSLSKDELDSSINFALSR